MNKALVQRLEQIDGKWYFDVVRVDVTSGEVLVLGRLEMSGMYRTAFGSCRIEGHALADAANIAANTALENAAALFDIRAVGQPAPPPAQNERHKPDDVPEPISRVTSRQLAAIHGVARRRGITLPELGAIVRERTGKTAVEHLSRKEASGLLDSWSQANGS